MLISRRLDRESRRDNEISERVKDGSVCLDCLVGLFGGGLKWDALLNLHRLSVLRMGFLLVNIEEWSILQYEHELLNEIWNMLIVWLYPYQRVASHWRCTTKVSTILPSSWSYGKIRHSFIEVGTYYLFTTTIVWGEKHLVRWNGLNFVGNVGIIERYPQNIFAIPEFFTRIFYATSIALRMSAWIMDNLHIYFTTKCNHS